MKRNETTYPKAFSHIGLTVPNLEDAVKFYREVMGWYVIMKPTEIKEENETAIGQMCIDVFGEGWGSFRIAHLATSDKIGIEIFEFKQATGKRPEFNPFTTGLFALHNDVSSSIRFAGNQYYFRNSCYRMGIHHFCTIPNNTHFFA